MSLLLLLATFIPPLVSTSSSFSSEWKTEDRFLGFRFEIEGKDLHPLIPKVVNEADMRACFGWIQEKLGTESLVGEVRCNKRMGEKMKEYLESTLPLESQIPTIGNGPNATIHRTHFKVYSDSKIRLHFSHFKVLHNKRITCFRDEPHKCDKEDMHVSSW